MVRPDPTGFCTRLFHHDLVDLETCAAIPVAAGRAWTVATFLPPAEVMAWGWRA